MIIKVIKEPLLPFSDQEPICEYGRTTLEIHIDDSVDYVLQRASVIHTVIENFCCAWPHDKVEELETLIIDGLDQLESKDAEKSGEAN